MKNKIIILTTFLLTLTLISCDKEENTVDNNEEVLEEVVQLVLPLTDCWAEIEQEDLLQFSGTSHTFCFISDSEFTLERESWTDIVSDINIPNSWTEYIKGSYTLTNESFEITGSYMDSDFMNFETSRFGESELVRTFEVKVVSENEMILDNNEDLPYLGIRLVN